MMVQCTYVEQLQQYTTMSGMLTLVISEQGFEDVGKEC